MFLYHLEIKNNYLLKIL